eukprot:5220227-Alexandrium_andersonii.AAC.1
MYELRAKFESGGNLMKGDLEKADATVKDMKHDLAALGRDQEVLHRLILRWVWSCCLGATR